MATVINPRSSQNINVINAMTCWDLVDSSRDTAYARASALQKRLARTSEHQAWAWAAATCGRVHAYRQQYRQAEIYLAEALGRFILVDDKYGECLASAHLAIPLLRQANADRGSQLAEEALTAGLSLAAIDRALLHNIAASCRFEFGDLHSALFHLNEANKLLTESKAVAQQAKIFANLGKILSQLGEFELSLEAFKRAFQLVDEVSRHEYEADWRSNMLMAKCRLGRLDEVSREADTLYELLNRSGCRTTWATYDNLAEAFARTERPDVAQGLLNKGYLLVGDSTASRFTLDSTAPIILEARGQYKEAIRLALDLLNHPVARVPIDTKRELAMILSRCHRALNQAAQARKWLAIAKSEGSKLLLGSLLANQIRAGLRVAASPVRLTPQELACLSLSARGQSSADIGLKLGITPRTVNFHFGKILKKLNALNRQEAIAKAISANLLPDL